MKIMTTLMLAGILILLSGCLDRGSQPQLVEPKDKESCESLGGTWSGESGPVLGGYCILPTRDASKECSDSDQCEGRCIAELTKDEKDSINAGQEIYRNGTCTSYMPVFGCHNLVEDGKVEGEICIG